MIFGELDATIGKIAPISDEERNTLKIPKGKKVKRLDDLLSNSSISERTSHYQSEANNMDLTPKPSNPNMKQRYVDPFVQDLVKRAQRSSKK